ncbi:phage portal protein [Bradyrhizobium cenepequi]
MTRPGIITRMRSGLKAFKRAYSGFDITGSSGKWPMQSVITAPISQQLAASRLASRKIAWLVENSALVASIVQNSVTAIVGDGPTVRPLHPDPDVNAYLQTAWGEFYSACDIEGRQSLGGLLARVARGFYIDGESFVQLVTDPQTMRLKLRLLTADQVDSSKTVPSLGMTGDQPMIIAGVEYDAVGRVVAYWVFRTPPDAPWASVSPAVRVPAEDVAHTYEPRFAGAPRGISPLIPIAGLAQELDQAHDAAIVKLKTTALVAMILRDLDGSAVAVDTATDPASIALEPGTTIKLPPGMEAQFPPTAEMTAIGEVLKHFARTCCAGAGVPYFMAANDYGEINYSAGKLGLATFQRRVKALQANHIVAQLLDPIWRRFVLLEVLSGRMRAPDFESNPERYGASFLWPSWPPLDELKQAKADTLNVAARLKSRAQIISENGRDVADTDAEIATDPYAAGNLSASAATIASQNEPENENA